MPNKTAERAVWAAIENRKPFTLDSVRMIGEVELGDIVAYLGMLLHQGYVEFCGMQTAASGEAVAVFRLVRREGPEAPYVDVDGRFVDPNLASRRKRQRRSSGPHREGPSLATRVRVAAEAMEASFSREELEQAVGFPLEVHASFLNAFYYLVTNKEIVREGNRWRYEPGDSRRTFQQIRQLLVESKGREVSAKEITDYVGDIRVGPQVRLAVAMLRAVGWTVHERKRRGVRPALYRAEPPADHAEPTA